MSETPRQYIRRMLRLLAGRHPVTVMRTTPQRLVRLTSGLSAAQLRRRPAAGKWSIAEIVAHLADGEMIIGHRMRLMFASPGGPIANYDQDFWAATGVYARQPVVRSLEEFRVLRAKNLRLLAMMPRRWWKRHGVHEVRGRESVLRLVQLYAGHDLNHLRQIELLRTQYRKEEPPMTQGFSGPPVANRRQAAQG